MPSIASVEMKETTFSFHVKSPLISPASTEHPSAAAMPTPTGAP